MVLELKECNLVKDNSAMRTNQIEAVFVVILITSSIPEPR
jgi:hypothetical protein